MNPAITILCDEHRSIAAVIKGMLNQVKRIKDEVEEPDFAMFAAMLEYITVIPERLHHPKENDYLFHILRMRDPESAALLDLLEAQHETGAELLDDLRRKLTEYREQGNLAPFDEALCAYAEFNWDHMGKEENLVLPRAEKYLTAADWDIINQAFSANRENVWQ